MNNIIKKTFIYIALLACIKTEQASAQLTTESACSLAALILGAGFVSHKMYKKITKPASKDKESKQEQSKTKKSARGIKKYLTPSILLPVSITALAGISFVSSTNKGSTSSNTIENITDPNVKPDSIPLAPAPPPAPDLTPIPTPPPAPAPKPTSTAKLTPKTPKQTTQKVESKADAEADTKAKIESPKTPATPHRNTTEEMAARNKAKFLKDQKIEATTPLTEDQLEAIHDKASEKFMKDIIVNTLSTEQKAQYQEYAEKHP